MRGGGKEGCDEGEGSQAEYREGEKKGETEGSDMISSLPAV